MNAAQIKKLGAIWGGQHGLLSVAELDELMRLVFLAYADASGTLRVLEIGHYHGLSTCGIVHALQGGCGDWLLDTLDAHCADQWVGKTEPQDFLRNMAEHFDDPRVTPLFARSETFTSVDGYDVVFYDGDHGGEQMRFTRLVDASPRTKLFIFDDRDFSVPELCCGYLLAKGWRDESLPFARLPGDKTNPETMTLGVFRRD